MAAPLQTAQPWRTTALGLLESIRQLPQWLKLRYDIPANHTVPDDFFGINVATSEDPRCDDYVIEALHELGLENVRLCYSYDSVGAAGQRLLERLLDEGFDVLLVLLPPRKEAAALASDAAAQTRWADFVSGALKRYGDRASAVEIGNTPNRGRWSGYSVQSYLHTWQIAAQAATEFDKPLAGPNVSDFEPIYNVGLLSRMQQQNATPGIHTDNLFVERVVEPEAFDLRVADRFTARLLNLNLIRKMGVLSSISRQFQIAQTYCTYTCWTHKRLSRWTDQPEQKHSHYLMRYLVLAAASGQLNRVYWGPLICQRDGLIRCGNTSYPDIDNVTYYHSVRGELDAFTVQPAFGTLGYCVQLLRGATCLQAHNDVSGVHHFVFSNPTQGHWHVVWCGDRRIYSLDAMYTPEIITDARCYSPEGEVLSGKPKWVTERPLVMRWDKPVDYPKPAQLQAIADSALDGVTYWPNAQTQIVELQSPNWHGAYSITATGSERAPSAAEIPALLPTLSVEKLLRDKRNKLWNVRAPWWSDGEQTVKLNRAKGIKRFTYRFLPSKGKRHWNNATEMMRLGVPTPRPLGFFEQPESNAADSYYVCQFVEGAFSCRDLFTAFMAGETQYADIDKQQWLEQVAQFVAHMHERGVIHRDLSSGNLMMTADQGKVTFFLIDIGRALIDRDRAKSARMRFKDLNRICYKLEWPDRETLIEAYDRASDYRLPTWWRWSLASYDWKQNAKKTLKGTKTKKHRKR